MPKNNIKNILLFQNFIYLLNQFIVIIYIFIYSKWYIFYEHYFNDHIHMKLRLFTYSSNNNLIIESGDIYINKYMIYKITEFF